MTQMEYGTFCSRLFYVRSQTHHGKFCTDAIQFNDMVEGVIVDLGLQRKMGQFVHKVSTVKNTL